MTNDLANYPRYIERLITLNVISGILKCFLCNVTSSSFSVEPPYLLSGVSSPPQ